LHLLNSSQNKLGALQQAETLDLTSKVAYETSADQTLCGLGTVSMASGGRITLKRWGFPGFFSPGIQSFNGNVGFGNSSFWSLPNGLYTFNLFATGTQTDSLSSITLDGVFTGSFTFKSSSNNWTLNDSGGHR
jgi:hypothetical protein